MRELDIDLKMTSYCVGSRRAEQTAVKNDLNRKKLSEIVISHNVKRSKTHIHNYYANVIVVRIRLYLMVWYKQ